MSHREEPLGLDAAVALQFLDRHPGEWYCTDCWAEAVDGDARVLYRMAVLMATDEAGAAGYRAKVDGPCKICDTKGSKTAGLKAFRSVQSLGKTVSA
jgi:hypothetical protein